MKYKKVEVTWFDAQTHNGYAEDIKELKNWEPSLSYSLGYLLYEDEEKIILGFLLFIENDKNSHVKHCQMIPRGMIKSIRRLKE